MGSVYFISFSTELDFAQVRAGPVQDQCLFMVCRHVVLTCTGRHPCQGSDQHRFIFNTLKSVNRTTYPWLVVNLHRPYLEPSVYGNNDKSDIFNQFDLDNAFAGERLRWGLRW